MGCATNTCFLLPTDLWLPPNILSLNLLGYEDEEHKVCQPRLGLASFRFTGLGQYLRLFLYGAVGLAFDQEHSKIVLPHIVSGLFLLDDELLVFQSSPLVGALDTHLGDHSTHRTKICHHLVPTPRHCRLRRSNCTLTTSSAALQSKPLALRVHLRRRIFMIVRSVGRCIRPGLSSQIADLRLGQ
ncbi:hypothetical protein B0H12DRAFT_378355 [Mycena haematopus]|nr:hypothetical protein B0H12DRAFT_378355 [Mycena haematopus]